MGVINGFKQFFSSIYALKDVIVGRKITTVGKDLQLLPDAGQITKIGAGSSSHSLASNGDLLVSGKIEAKGTAYMDGEMYLSKFIATPQLTFTSDGYWKHSENDGFLLALIPASHYHFIITTDTNRYKDHDHSVASADPTFFVHSSTDPDIDNTQWLSLTHNKTDARVMAGKGGVVVSHAAPVELADDASFDLPDASAGWGTLMVGDNEEYTTFRWGADGTVVLEDDATANVVATDTDANLCIFDNGTAVRVRNRLGSAKKIMFTYNYTTP